MDPEAKGLQPGDRTSVRSWVGLAVEVAVEVAVHVRVACSCVNTTAGNSRNSLVSQQRSNWRIRSRKCWLALLLVRSAIGLSVVKCPPALRFKPPTPPCKCAFHASGIVTGAIYAHVVCGHMAPSFFS